MENQNTNVTLQDIAVVVQIIDACSERGSFKGNELSAVGALREKFNRIVQENAPKGEEAGTEDAGATEAGE